MSKKICIEILNGTLTDSQIDVLRSDREIQVVDNPATTKICSNKYKMSKVETMLDLSQDELERKVDYVDNALIKIRNNLIK